MFNLISSAGVRITFVILSLFFAAISYQEHRAATIAKRDIPVEQLPMQIGEWQAHEGDTLPQSSRDILKLDRYVRRGYRAPDGSQVYLYLGYWKHQSGDHQAAKHSPALCLPANGWKTTLVEPVSLSSGSEQIPGNRLVGDLNGHSSVFYYWFFGGEEFYRNESEALLILAIQNLLYGRSDGGIIEISTGIGTNDQMGERTKTGNATIERFLKDFLPEFTKLVHSSGAPSVTD